MLYNKTIEINEVNSRVVLRYFFKSGFPDEGRVLFKYIIRGENIEVTEAIVTAEKEKLAN